MTDHNRFESSSLPGDVGPPPASCCVACKLSLAVCAIGAVAGVVSLSLLLSGGIAESIVGLIIMSAWELWPYAATAAMAWSFSRRSLASWIFFPGVVAVCGFIAVMLYSCVTSLIFMKQTGARVCGTGAF